MHYVNVNLAQLSNITIKHILQVLLAAAGVGSGFAFLEHVSLELFEAGFAGFHFRADAAVPRAVALLDELGEAAVLADGVGNLQPAREGVHSSDVSVEQVDGFEAFAAHLGVEVGAAGREATHVQDGEHDLGG